MNSIVTGKKGTPTRIYLLYPFPKCSALSHKTITVIKAVNVAIAVIRYTEKLRIDISVIPTKIRPSSKAVSISCIHNGKT